ncbi:unnamed protein product [Pleuronectes platessa]|uniref:Uncharacterized protein n=1 Tax=Pleuronectes platessa TaxID=8262 RepID=A0A9N7TH23_PLEPL|nr:unnamed protein product [Pleuronectes platessa]
MRINNLTLCLRSEDGQSGENSPEAIPFDGRRHGNMERFACHGVPAVEESFESVALKLPPPPLPPPPPCPPPGSIPSLTIVVLAADQVRIYSQDDPSRSDTQPDLQVSSSAAASPSPQPPAHSRRIILIGGSRQMREVAFRIFGIHQRDVVPRLDVETML